MSAQKFDLLSYFVENSGRAIAAQELIEQGVLRPAQSQRYKDLIVELRCRLGPAGDFIQAVHGYGFRLDEPVGVM